MSLMTVAAGLIGASAVFATQLPAGSITEEIRSESWQVRSRALTMLNNLPPGEKETAFGDAGLQKTISSLLADENERISVSFVTGVGVGREYGEGYSEYYAELLEASLALLPLVYGTDRGGEFLEALVLGSYNPDSSVVTTLAGYGDDVANVAFKMTTAPLIHQRWNAYELLGAVVGQSGKKAQSKSSLSAATRRQAISVLSQALQSDDVTIVRHAIHALGETGSDEALTVLQAELAKPDRPRSGDDLHYRTTRHEELVKAVMRIQAKR